ncbi:hypothetical protein [Endozoicomonas sp. 8E]|uniref:hypothetical protein n=1 Tax=Endozoicomonas sp. 8E TaxID=3035692 RepID=UPI002938E764|nr:hypothetical protein [Endozoicomonas sp. 8E]WOG26912.1 hypothetical protein P6910_20540 [Endozoicomonas sp. 8E]
MIKKPLFAALLLLSVTCRAQVLTERYIVEIQQNTGSPDESFSIKQHDLHKLLLPPATIANTNGHPVRDFPVNDTAFGLSVHGLKTVIIESISWHLLYSTPLLVAYELFLTTHDTSQSPKIYSRLAVEAFIAVGWLLNSYWNPDSSMFNTIGELQASQDYPFAINTMMLSPADNQQHDLRSKSSSQQASGTGTRLMGTFTSHEHYASCGRKRDPELNQHTFGLNCFADDCNGVCQFRQAGARPGKRSRLNKDFDRQPPCNELPSPFPPGTSETQEITTHTTKSSQLGQSQPHFSKTGTIQTLSEDQGLTDYDPPSDDDPLSDDDLISDDDPLPDDDPISNDDPLSDEEPLSDDDEPLSDDDEPLSDDESDYFIEPPTCDIVLGRRDGQWEICGKVCEPFESLSEHKSTHRRRQPFDMDE